MAVSLSIWVKRGFFMPDVGGQPLSTEYIFSCVSAELPVVLEVSNYTIERQWMMWKCVFVTVTFLV